MKMKSLVSIAALAMLVGCATTDATTSDAESAVAEEATAAKEGDATDLPDCDPADPDCDHSGGGIFKPPPD